MRTLPLLLAAPALLAQAPASAPAQTYAQKVKPQLPTPAAIRENPTEALAKAKSLLPEGGKLPFDKTDVQTAGRSINEWRAHIDVQSVIANAALAAGQWEDAKDAAEKARDLAKELQAEGYQPYNAYKQLWQKAKDEATKNLETLKALEAKPEAELKPEDKAQLAELKQNEPVYRDNVAKSQIALASVDRSLKFLSDQTTDFDATITGLENRLKTEAEELVKFKTPKALAQGILVSIEKDATGNVDNKLIYLRRALQKDPSNAKIQHRIDVLLGKAEDKPEPVKKGGKKKGH